MEKDIELINIDGHIVSKDSIRKQILDRLKTIKEQISGKKFKPNEENIKFVIELYEILKSEFKSDEGYEVELEMFYPALSYGSITVTGRNISIDSKLFKKMISKVGELEIASYEDGTVSLIFGFRKLMELEK